MLRVVCYPNGTRGLQAEVGVEEGKAVKFATGTMVVAGWDFDEQGLEVTVSIGGVMAHDTSTGRARAHAYLIACDIADEMEAALCGYRPDEATEKHDLHALRVIAARFDGRRYTNDGVRKF